MNSHTANNLLAIIKEQDKKILDFIMFFHELEDRIIVLEKNKNDCSYYYCKNCKEKIAYTITCPACGVSE